ncbi:hypothetical protein SOHN41_01845 [Shewanella sp. HN-41]|nr:hypothetical protein SOHN41_01845 [Shewanella sp. HN-41]
MFRNGGLGRHFFILNLMVLLRIENLFIEILFNIPTQQ